MIIKKVQNSSTYDEMYDEGGDGGTYDLPYQHSCYYPLFKKVHEKLRMSGSQNVLEVGCGTGSFAHMLRAKSPFFQYKGFDFSSVAVKKAKIRCKSESSFFVGDAMDPTSYDSPYDVIVCTEVLEHIPEDLLMIENWKKGIQCVCSVPNFDSQYHERFFENESDVRIRYEGLIEIKSIIRVKKPVLPDISTKNFLQELIWARTSPRKIMRLFGIGSFEDMGGWFLFSGVRK